MTPTSVNYYEYTLCQLINKDIKKFIDEIRNGYSEPDSGRNVYGTNRVLSLYADHGKNLDFTPIDQLSSVDNGCIAKTGGGFFIFNNNEIYFLFKQSESNTLTKEESDRVKKLVEKYELSDMNEIHDKEMLALIDNGLTTQKPLSKNDFVTLFYNALNTKTEKGKALADGFFKAEHSKPTKKYLGTLSLHHIFYRAEALKMDLFAPYIEGGYSFSKEEQFRIGRGLNAEAIYSSNIDKINQEFKLEIDQYLAKIEEIKRKNKELNEKDFSLDVFTEKSILKEDLLSIFKRLEKMTEGFDMSQHLEENEKSGFFSEITIENTDCPSDIDPSLTKRGLQNSSTIAKFIKSNPDFAENHKWKTTTVKTVFDYGIKTDLKNLLSYAQSLIKVTNNSVAEKKKVGEIEKIQEDGVNHFAL